jgi:hypothetical protein
MDNKTDVSRKVEDFPIEIIDRFNQFIEYCRFKDHNAIPVLHSVTRKNGKQAIVLGIMINNPNDNSLHLLQFGEVFPVGLDTTKIYDFPDGIDDKNTLFANN